MYLNTDTYYLSAIIMNQYVPIRKRKKLMRNFLFDFFLLLFVQKKKRVWLLFFLIRMRGALAAFLNLTKRFLVKIYFFQGFPIR